MKNSQKGFILPIVIVIVIILIAASGGFIYFNQASKNVPENNIPEPIACTLDAVQCPDGSYVGRTGPDCEFVCPLIEENIPVVEPVSPIFEPTKTVVEIAKGGNSGVTEAKNIIINDEEKWQEVWNQIYAHHSRVPPLPKINFLTKTVIAVFAGQRSSGGHSLSVKQIEELSNVVNVTVEYIYPARNCLVTAALTEPFYIASVSKITKPVNLLTVSKEQSCN